jgi:ferric-dicitrate binding protein FerR (iron transport regulator)
MEQNRITFLLKKYGAKEATPEEVDELFDLMRTGEPDDDFKKIFVETVIQAEPEIILREENWASIWNKIIAQTFQKKRNKVSVAFWLRNVAAGVLIAVIGIGAFFVLDKKKSGINASGKLSNDKNDIRPGSNKAILTLANGSTIILDTVQNGYLTDQSNVKIIKLNTGMLSYKSGSNADGKSLLNTITTPRGGQYQVELEDGTKVWLNSASSLVFPVSFTGKERRVELTGEGYFEVAKNESMPFHVTVNNMDVRVLGTHFNIMGYGDEENINTTLLEGKVNVTVNNVTKSLDPGKEALLNKATNNISINKANIDQAVAWKNGEFRFRNTNIKAIMRQVARWYDVDVEYETTATNQYFTASLPRMKNINELLETLELTGTIHFKIENKKMIVLP